MRPIDLWSLAALASTAVSNPLLHVNTTSGTVQGFIDAAFPSVVQFHGIPYAEPPIGPRRWRPPVPIHTPSAKILDATRTAPICPQFAFPGPSLETEDAPKLRPLPNSTQSENCLLLYVWTPRSALASSKGLPVLLYVHGGSFQTGAALTPYTNAEAWVERLQDHVVISIQYRLNIFGFPNTPLVPTQNLGLLDIRLALEWTHANARTLGGNPERIALWGQSAGAVAIDYMSFAHPTKPLAAAKICDSGTAFIPIQNRDFAGTNFSSIISRLGCPAGNAQQQLKCARALPAASLTALLQADIDSSAPTVGTLPFTPIPDNATVFADYAARFQSEAFATTPTVYGTNTDEGSAFVLYPAPGAPPPSRASIDAITSGLFLCDAIRASALRTARGAPTYRYLYGGNFSDISPRSWEGAFHGSELPLVFGTAQQGSALEVGVRNAMQRLWVAFAAAPAAPTGWREVRRGAVVGLGLHGQALSYPAAEAVDRGCLSS